MRSDHHFGAGSAPPELEALQRARVLGRIEASAAVADVVAMLAYGAPRRDDFVLLADLTASRTATSNLGVAHG